jgi:hypothetical protein
VAKDGYPAKPPMKFQPSASALYISMVVATRST